MSEVLTWRYMTLYPETVEVAVPDCPPLYFHHHELTLAVQERDRLCARQGIMLYHSRPAGNYHNRHDKGDQSLPPGITREIKPIPGSPFMSHSLRCQANGKTISRSVTKYGEDGALKLVLEWQAEQQALVRERRRQAAKKKEVMR